MLTILRLMRREIEDHAVLYMLSPVIGLVYCAVVMRQCTDGGPMDMPIFFLLLFLPFTCIAAAALGGIQMATDRAGRVSGFLATLPVTRAHVLGARYLTGLVWICLVIVLPATFLFRYVLATMCPWAQVARPMEYPILEAFLLVAAAYATGLQLSLSFRKTWAVSTAAAYAMVFSVMVIKGLDRTGLVLVFAYTAASLARTWYKSMDLSL